MNFLDTYDLAGSNTPLHGSESEQTLNEEVNQVIGQLGRFWGGVRKQSQSAFETARKDLGEVVSQAQKELSKFNGEAPASEESANEAENDARTESSSEADTPLAASTSESSQQADLSSSSLFTRLQSAFPPNIVSTVQNNIPETLKHATENIDLAQLRATLSTEFHRVQDVTMAHAGQYVHKSEEILREAMKEAGEVLKDAVKVIPPEDSDTGSATGMVWDGTDIWMLPTPAGELFESAGKGKGKETSAPSSSRPSSEAQRAVATRAESLLKQLKRNPEIIKHDPESDNVVRELYATWVRTEVEAKSGGIEGDEWSTKVAGLLSEPGDGPALQASQDALVPSEMTKETFWKRYFFRVYQIGREEEKRKALLRGSIENEEVFSWEDEEEEATSPTRGAQPSSAAEPSPPDGQNETSTQSEQPPSAISKPVPSPSNDSVPASQAQTSTHTSPRESSEESYDLLSSENDSAIGDKRKAEKKNDGDDPDSDWE